MRSSFLDQEAVTRLSDEELLERARSLNTRNCRLTAALLVHLGEVDARRLYADNGCSWPRLIGIPPSPPEGG